MAGGTLLALALLAALTLGGAPAQATFPGENGRLVCEGQRGPEAATGESRTEIFTIKPDGTDQEVLTDNRVRDGDPAFSPGGEFITWESFREEGSEVWRMKRDGTDHTRLTTNGPPEDRSTNWSSDGTKIAFHSTRDRETLPDASPFEIYIMDADGSNQTRITENTAQDTFPQWSPDGTRLTFTSNRSGDFEIYTMKPDGSDVQRVTESPGEDAHSTWSPDGTQLTFHSRRAGGLDIFRQNADGSGEATQVTNLGAEDPASFAFFPVWSPDGTRIAYNGNTAEVRDFEVYHVDAVDGSDRVRVSSSPGFDGRCDWEALAIQEPPLPPPPAPPVAPAVNPCGDPAAAGYLHPAKIRVSRARVLRSDRRLDVFAPITSRARGADVKVTYQGDNRRDTFEATVTPGGGALDQVRFKEPITRGQARLGTGIVNLTYLGDADTRPEFVRLRAGSQRAELDVEEISLIGDRLSAQGSLTAKAEGVIRLRYSYLDPDGTPNVHEARAEIQDDGDWKLDDDVVPFQLAQCGGYLSIQFTGYFERRIRGEQVAYQLNAGQTRRP